MRVEWIGSLTLRRLHLVHRQKFLLPPRPLFWCRFQELLSPQKARNPGEGGEGRPNAQPITIRHPARLTSRPRLSEQPMRIQLAVERPSPGQQPMTSRRWGVPQWSIPTASPPLCWHSLPSQRPIRMQDPHLTRTTLNSGRFISRPNLTPDRIWLPPTLEITSQDLASPHLLLSNPPPNPSLDCLLGPNWLVHIERLGKLIERDWDCVPAGAPRRSPRHAAASRSRLDRSCRLRETNQTTHCIGHRSGRREFPDTRTTLAAVPQTPPQSLNGRIPTIQVLASPLVWLGVTHWYKREISDSYKQKGSLDATPPGIIPGTAGSPLRVWAAPPWYWTGRYTTWNYPGNSWLPAKGLSR